MHWPGREAALDNANVQADLGMSAMAAEVLGLMRQLSHDRFALAGHDRRGLVGHRLALEHSEAISHAVMLDIVLVLDVRESISADAAVGAYHVFFLAQPPDLPEQMLAGSPEAFADSFLDGWSTLPDGIRQASRVE